MTATHPGRPAGGRRPHAGGHYGPFGPIKSQYGGNWPY
jgi:hypothetical protein